EEVDDVWNFVDGALGLDRRDLRKSCLEGTRIQLREIGAAEQRQTRVDDLAALFLTMHECGEFLGDGTLGSSSLRPLLGLPGQLLDLFTRTEAERPERSEEHTSELQSRFDLVCR